MLAVEPFLRDAGARGQNVRAKVTVVKRIALASDPKASRLPKFDCSEGKKRSIFLGLDHPRILQLGAFFAGREILVGSGSFEDARPALVEYLNRFNATPAHRDVGAMETRSADDSDVTLGLAPSPCSMPDHTWTGTGCRPASGGGGGLVALTVQVDGAEPTTQFGKVHNEFAAFAFGYCLSVELDQGSIGP
jgi:hypothetical protein